MTVNWISLSWGQNKTFEDVILGFERHWATFFIIFWHFRDQTTRVRIGPHFSVRAGPTSDRVETEPGPSRTGNKIFMSEPDPSLTQLKSHFFPLILMTHTSVCRKAFGNVNRWAHQRTRGNKRTLTQVQKYSMPYRADVTEPDLNIISKYLSEPGIHPLQTTNPFIQKIIDRTAVLLNRGEKEHFFNLCCCFI